MEELMLYELLHGDRISPQKLGGLASELIRSWAARQVQSPAEHARLEILALGGVHLLMGPMPKGMARESASMSSGFNLH